MPIRLLTRESDDSHVVAEEEAVAILEKCLGTILKAVGSLA